MHREGVEIMSPAGNFESLVAAIQGGANAVYFGIGHLNMRSHSANNFNESDLQEIVRICKESNVKTYLTLNITLYDEDLDAMHSAVDSAKSAGVTAIIASDISAIRYAREVGVEVHISTQLNIANIDSVRYYSQFADVMVLARELNLNQIKAISKKIDDEQIKGPAGNLVKLELFAHGALCMAISGKCYLSLHEVNASANRGNCHQICRRGYEVTELDSGRSLHVDNEYIMSPKDLATIEFVDKILDAGVSVLKIEGRARSAEYVKTVTSAYRKAVDAYFDKNFTDELKSELKAQTAKVFNRGFWDGYYQGARLGEWSEVYGNKATRRKVYVAKVTNFFTNLSVAEVLVETGEICVGDEVVIIGPSTGVNEFKVEEIRVNLESVNKAIKGDYCSIPVTIGTKLRRSDKIYLWKESGEIPKYHNQ